eukprot:EG_transcript_6386
MLQRSPGRPAAGTPRKGSGSGGGVATADRAELAQKLEAQRLYIARLEATLAAGGLTEKCARLEGKLQRAQQRAQAAEAQLLEQRRVGEEQGRELEALRAAVRSKVEDWGIGNDGGTTDTAELVVSLARAREDARRLQQQLADQAGEAERLQTALAELGRVNRVLQTSIDQHVVESRQTQEHVKWLTSEIQATEETKLQMLGHMEQAVEELRLTRDRLKKEEEARKASEAKAKQETAMAQAKVAEAQAEVAALEAQSRQLLLLRALHTQRAGEETGRAEQLGRLAKEQAEHIEQLTAAKVQLERRVASLEQRLSEAVQQRDTAAQQLVELQRAHAALAAQADALAARGRGLEAAEALAEQRRAAQERAERLLGRVAEHCAHFLRSCGLEVENGEDAYALACRIVSHAAKAQVDHDTLQSETRHRTVELEDVVQALQEERDELNRQLQSRQQETQRLQLLNDAGRRRCLAAVREQSRGLADALGDGRYDGPALLESKPQPGHDPPPLLQPVGGAFTHLPSRPSQAIGGGLLPGQRPPVVPTLTDLARCDLELL